MEIFAEVEGGKIRGCLNRRETTVSFKGVPFAAPPVGELRWKRPQPVIPWDGIRDCTEFASIPAQMNTDGSLDYHERKDVSLGIPSEDCLYLNVWTPVGAKKESHFPVLFWIFGGGFVVGAPNAPEFNGEGFAERGIVVVTVNYRLGPIGFLAHPLLSAENEEGISGNYAIWDLIKALHWVRDNIEEFGGDPNTVTIAGQSAGAGCTHTLCSSQLTKGLFKRASLQHSGGAREDLFLRYRSLKEQEEIGEKIFENLDVKTLEEARKLPWEDIFKASFQVKVRENMPNMPIVDGVILKYGLTETLLRNEHHDIDYMIGHTVPTGVLPIKIDETAAVDGFIEESRTFYLEYADEFLALVKADTPEKVAAYKRQRYSENILSGDINFCEAQNLLGRKPAYFWQFKKRLPGDDIGTYVGSEHWYLFRSFEGCWRPFTEEDQKLSELMNRCWCRFIKSGDPNGGDDPHWEPYTTETKKSMEFSDQSQTMPVVIDEILDFRKRFVLRSLIDQTDKENKTC